MTFWRWLCAGSDELVMPESWLADQARIAAYSAWTERQLNQGRIVTDTAGMARRAFWQAQEAKRTQAPSSAKVIRGGRFA